MSKNNKIIITVTAVILILVAVTLGLFFGLRNNDDNKETPIVDDNYLISTEYFHVDQMDKYEDQALAIHFKVDLDDVDFNSLIDDPELWFHASGTLELEADLRKDFKTGWTGLHYSIVLKDVHLGQDYYYTYWDSDLGYDDTTVVLFEMQADAIFMEGFSLKNLKHPGHNYNSQTCYMKNVEMIKFVFNSAEPTPLGIRSVNYSSYDESYLSYFAMDGVEIGFATSPYIDTEINLNTYMYKNYVHKFVATSEHWYNNVQLPILESDKLLCLDITTYSPENGYHDRIEPNEAYIFAYDPELWLSIFISEGSDIILDFN